MTEGFAIKKFSPSLVSQILKIKNGKIIITKLMKSLNKKNGKNFNFIKFIENLNFDLDPLKWRAKKWIITKRNKIIGIKKCKEKKNFNVESPTLKLLQTHIKISFPI